MATLKGQERIPQIRTFEADEKFRKSIEKGIVRAPNGKLAGKDELFAEMMKIDKKLFANLLITIWNECEELNYFPIQLQTAIFVPVREKD